MLWNVWDKWEKCYLLPESVTEFAARHWLNYFRDKFSDVSGVRVDLRQVHFKQSTTYRKVDR